MSVLQPHGQRVLLARNGYEPAPQGGRAIMIGCQQFFQESWYSAYGDANYETFVANLPRWLMGGRTGKTIVLVQRAVDLTWYSQSGGSDAVTVGSTVRSIWQTAGYSLNVIDVTVDRIDWVNDIPVLSGEGDIVVIGAEFADGLNGDERQDDLRSWLTTTQGAVIATLKNNRVTTVTPVSLYTDYAFTVGHSYGEASTLTMQDTESSPLFAGVSSLTVGFWGGRGKVNRPDNEYPDTEHAAWRGYRTANGTYTLGLVSAYSMHEDIGAAGTQWSST